MDSKFHNHRFDAGVRYFIRVLSKTNTGFSAPQNAMPYPLAPMAVPEVPSTVILSVDTTDSLLLEWKSRQHKKIQGFEWLPCNKISDSMGSYRVNEVQQVSIKATGGSISSGGYKLRFDKIIGNSNYC